MSGLSAQEKIPLDHSVYELWNSVGNPRITDNGKFVSYEINPLKGDGYLIIVNMTSGKSDTVFRGYDAVFLPGDEYLVAKIKPEEKKVLQMKRAKKKKDELPSDSLIILTLGNFNRQYFANVESFQVAMEDHPVVAFRKKYLPPAKDSKEEEETEPAEGSVATGAAQENPEAIGESTVQLEEKVKKKTESLAKKYKPGDLFIIDPARNTSQVYENVLSYSMSRNGNMTAFIQLKQDTLPGFLACAWLGAEQNLVIAGEGAGIPSQLAVNDKGTELAYSVTSDSARVSGLNLFYWTPGIASAGVLLDSAGVGLKTGWGLSKNGSLFFSEDGSLLYFGAAPVLPVQPEDTILKEEKYSVDVWNWKDSLLQPEQLKNLAKDKKQTWLAVIRPGERSAVQLADSTVSRIRLLHRNNGKILLGLDDTKYERLMNWEGFRYEDAWLIDVESGKRQLIAEKLPDEPTLSAFGKYVLWYQNFDSAWYAYSIADGITRNLTGAIGLPFYDEDNDVPSVPGSYGLAGWTKDDRYVLICDRYDIWKIDPSGKEKPVCFTSGDGRKNRIRYRYEAVERDSWYIDLDKPVYLSGFNTDDMSSGFAVIAPGSKSAPTALIQGPWRYSQLARAKDCDRFIWQKQDFSHCPDLWSSGMRFGKAEKISDANPQQRDYLWGDARLVEWVSYAGDTLKGLLYTPENLDPEGSYPMLVYYYERNSENLYRYSMPSPSRSTISFSWCVSNGYVVFVPDIVYRDGYPGQSAYDAVVSGTEAMTRQFPFIDSKRMGLQGQSWGGYQTAYLVTRTNLFAAAMAGAPVSNMTSAYGGIRWGTGLSRMFQYEHSQSRIGGTLWEHQDLYLENSPLFFAPQVETPLLVMHNDDDGAVPWYQGIEFFTALRRLDKPVWMLVYNGEEHNLTKWPNRVDLSIRMMQFFDHYLKGSPEPEWMSQGIPAVRKGETTGYETE
ncbi:MAG: alpha/beta hydrolase family protein [Bacteroidota bacterium]